MEEKNINISCWSGKENSTGTVEKAYKCPVCRGEVEEVKNITVKHFLNDSYKDGVKNESYYICLNEICEAVYFSGDRKSIFTKEDIKEPIWFKKDASPKYICYCNKVTEQEIIDAVVNQNAKTMKDVIRITGAMKNAKYI